MERRAIVALAFVLAPAACGVADAAARRATVEGVGDRALLVALERAIGDEKAAPANRVDARRRARLAADSAVALLRSEGYYDGSADPTIGEGARPRPVVRVSLGVRTLLQDAKIGWEGSSPGPVAEAAAARALALKAGQPARAADVIAAEGRIVAALQAAGYADAAAGARQVVVDHQDHAMHVAYAIASGALVRLGAMQVQSKGRTKRAWLQRLVSWKPTEVYRPEKVAELERRLLDTQVYDSVTVALAPKADANGLRPVIVSLADRARHTFEFGAGYSTTEGGDVDLRLSTYNRLGRGDTLTYEARYGDIDSRLGVELALPHFGHPGQTLTTDLYAFQTRTDAYTETGLRLSGDLTQRFGRTSFITRGASITASEVDDKETGHINIATARLLGAFALDRTDNALDPHRGFKLDARVEPTAIGGDEKLLYLKLQSQASAYLPLGRGAGTVVAGRVHLGSIVGGKIPLVPASDRFFAGGGGSVRGYEYQSVGPLYPDRTPIGGLSLVEASVELRHSFTHTLGGVLFVDTGAVGEQVQPDFRHTSTAVGAGVRYNLGFAPIRADLAFPLQPNALSKQAVQIYLSIGQAF